MSNTTFNQAFILINSLYIEDNEIDYLSIMESDPYFYNKLRCRCQAKTEEDYLQGIKLFEDYLNSNPNHALSYHFIASAYYLSNDNNDKALIYSEKAITYNPKNALFYNLRGVINLNNSNYAEALKYFNKSIILDSSFSLAYINRGYYYLQMDNIELAEIDFRKAILLNPNNEFAYRLGYLIDLQNENYQAALEKLNTAIAVDNKYRDAYSYRAELNEYLNKIDEAIADFTSYIQLTSGLTGIGYFYRGMTKLRNDDLSGAIEDLVKCMELSPSWECEYQLTYALNDKPNKTILEQKLFNYYKHSPFTAGLYNDIYAKGLNIPGEEPFKFNEDIYKNN